jgi:molecular chaperone GrpE
MANEENIQDPKSAASDDPQQAASPDPAGAEPPQSDLDRVTAERDKMREQLLRTAADFENFRKRTRRDLEDAQRKGQQDVVRDLLPVFDNLERAVQAAGTASDVTSVIDGINMVLKLFEASAERIGLVRIKTVGERFDPAVHEAIQQKESHDAPPGSIVAEVVPGYRFGEKLVRAAMVVVARKPADAKKTDAPPAEAAKAASVPPSAANGEAASSSSETNSEGKGA